MRLLVAGGGLAGSVAALVAREAGAEVRLVRAAPGASALSLGLVEVAGERFIPSLGEPAPRGVGDPLAAARQVAALTPGHPYRTLQASLERIPEALGLLPRWFPAVFGPMVPGRFATPLGTVRRAAGAQRSQAAGALVDGSRLALVGFRDDPALFDAGLVAAGLAEAGLDARAAWCDFLDRRELVGRSPFELAALLDRPEEARRLGESVGRAIARDAAGATLALLPPIAGIERPVETLERIGAAAGLRAGETLGWLPSVPGFRLQRALDAALRQAGVELVEAELRRLEPGRALLESERTLDFDRAVLATGRFIGGGVRRGETFVEPLVGLPLWDGRVALAAQLIEPLLGDSPEAPAAAFRAGVRIDQRCRALDGDGRPLGWLWAAGSVVGGADQGADGAGLGLCALTGLLAGRDAVAAS